MAHQSLRDEFPFHLVIGERDCTFLLDENFTFSNVDPGGYEMASFPLPLDLPWVMRGMPVRLDCGTQIAWEGRVQEVQRSLGAKTLVQCEGYGARLRDQQLREIFVDRDLTKWTGPSLAQQIERVSKGATPSGPSIGLSAVPGTPALITAFTGPWVEKGLPECEAWYNSHGIPINSIHYAWTKGKNVNNADAHWEWFVFLSTNETASSTDSTANLRGVGPGEGSLTSTTNTRVFAVIFMDYNFTGGEANVEYALYWENIAVYGSHGLTKRGSEPGGFYTSDIVGWVAEQLEEIKPGIIPVASQFIVSQSTYLTDVEAQQIVADMTKFVGYHWGVWESLTYLTDLEVSPRLDFRPYPQQGEYTAWCMRNSCESLDIREDLSDQYNAAIVMYREPSGEENRVEVQFKNPILEKAGILKRTIPLSLGVATKASAKEYGELALELLSEQARVIGSAQINEPIYNAENGVMAPWMLKSGIDRLRIPDLGSSDVWGDSNEFPITRVECSGGVDGIKTNVEFGQRPNLLEVLTSQLEVATNVATGA